MKNLEQTVENWFLDKVESSLKKIKHSVAGKIAVYSLAGVLSGAGLGYGCGEEEPKPEDYVTIEGTIYLQPAWMRSESEKLGSATGALSASPEYSHISQELEEGTSNWECDWCAAASTVKECGECNVKGNQYNAKVPSGSAVVINRTDLE